MICPVTTWWIVNETQSRAVVATDKGEMKTETCLQKETWNDCVMEIYELN